MADIQIDVKSSLNDHTFYFLDQQIDNWLTVTFTNITDDSQVIEAGTLLQMQAKFGRQGDCLTQVENKSKILFYFNDRKGMQPRVLEEYIESEFLETITIPARQSYRLEIRGIYPLQTTQACTFALSLWHQGKVIKTTCTFSRKEKAYAIHSFTFGKMPLPGETLSMDWDIIGAKTITINKVDVTDMESYELVLQTLTTIIVECMDECNNHLLQRHAVEPRKVQIKMFGLYYKLDWRNIIKECFWNIENATGVMVNQQDSSAKVDSYQNLDVPLYMEIAGYPNTQVLEISIDAFLERGYTVKLGLVHGTFIWFVTEYVCQVLINGKKVERVGEMPFLENQEFVFLIKEDMENPVFKATIKQSIKS